MLNTSDHTAQQHSNQLKQLIMQTIQQSGGFISFEQYMHMCLYTPGLGYYSAGSHKLGRGGDFTTAPELSSLFASALARHASTVFQHTRHQVLEFGAGSGVFAKDFLNQLSVDDVILENYFIIETSADLKQRQKTLLQKHLPHLMEKVSWLEAVPISFEGVVIANEVCDAMPTHLIRFSENLIQERGIGLQNADFVWKDRLLENLELKQTVQPIQSAVGNATDYVTEKNLNAPQWLAHVGKSMVKGAMFIIDYGYSFADYYDPERMNGTVMCFYQHKAHDNPLILPGLQDITSHVDFTSLAEAAVSADLDVSGFHLQSDFLIAGDITSLAQSLADTVTTEQWLHESAALKQLLLPSEMGEQFKVLTLSKSLPLLERLQLNDKRYQL